MSLPIVFASPEISASLHRGHPWVYRTNLLPPRDGGGLPRYPSGTWVRVLCGKFEGIGLWEADGAIAVRMFARAQVPDGRWIAARVGEAWQLRSPLRGAEGGQTTAYRWIYGESDALPGVVVDLYGAYAVVCLYASGLRVLLPSLVEALKATAALRGIVLKQVVGAPEEVAAGGALEQLWGRPAPADLIVEENGLRYYANVGEGQKTGLFLDQRENRRTLAPWCAGRRVLDCFCYAGAFTLHALRGGARYVVGVDAAAGAIEQARRNLHLNGYDAEQCAFHVADCFAWLEACAGRKERFGLVIVDPPSLARRKENRHAAMRAYVRLNRLALRCLESGGLLASSSCSSQVSPEMFREALAEAAAQAGMRLAIVHEAGHPLDHPVAPQLLESRYLKFVLAQARA